MKKNGVLVIVAIILILSLISSASAWSYNQHKSIKGQKTWNPWSTPAQMGMQQPGYGMGMQQPGYGMGVPMMPPMRYGGMFMGPCWDPYMCGYSMWANETQIAEVSGTWETDLLGTMSIMLTGDDTIRGIYEVDDIKGYFEGNFTTAETQGMDGVWWEEPSYQPPMSAGIIAMTFTNESSFEGVFSYPDGMWGAFTGTKVSGEFSEGVEEELKNMPEINWDVNVDEVKEYRVTNEPEENPVMQGESEEVVDSAQESEPVNETVTEENPE